ncbi:MAG TPA: UDP-glucose 4-epimerase GalE, partial [Saprospiraceae bacterium]|nr:UDP-glucose 4-epimerase GalE [Saprospiraceae bacterium]
VTGGCGYIGSHTVVELIETGFEVICVDDLSNSDGSALHGIKAITGKDVTFYNYDIGDTDKMQEVFDREGRIDGIIHFAAFKAVNESVQFPLKYYVNNVAGLISLLQLALKNGCNRFLFSSSCSVYGDADRLPVSESSPLGEIRSPYARTKLICEEILIDLASSGSTMKSIALRYFNPAGAHPSNEIGESPTINASNLVPVITETAIGKRPGFTVFGQDYDTRDGTCIRDYIHVSDIAAAHALAMKLLLESHYTLPFDIYNLGSATGNTVLEVIEAFVRVNDIKPNYVIGPRRAGDVVAVYADNSKAKEQLGWKLRYNLDDIVRTAWNWEKKRSGRS